MNNISRLLLISTLTLLACIFIAAGCSDSQTQKGSSTDHQSPEPDEPELARHMADIQRYTHKVGLSVEARNQELSAFYLHELEEAVEGLIEEVPEYEGYAIAELTETMLVPVLEPLDKQIDNRNWEEASKRMDDMIQSCNSCHVSTDHGFLKVTAGAGNNPYNQVFEPDH